LSKFDQVLSNSKLFEVVLLDTRQLGAPDLFSRQLYLSKYPAAVQSLHIQADLSKFEQV
jgi:hypothetical protein